MPVIGFFGNLAYEWPLPVLGGALRYCRDHKEVRLRDYLFTQPQSLDGRRPAWHGRVDGVVLATNFMDGAVSAETWLHAGGVPGISVVSNFISKKFPSVFTDPASVAALAFREFQTRGVQSILSLGFQGGYGSEQRHQALCGLAAQTSISVRHEALPLAPKDSHQLAAEWLCDVMRDSFQVSQADRSPLGVFAANDEVARAAVDTCETLGFTVPTQVLVIGVDDSPVAFSRRPTITSIRFPGEEMGYRAVDILVRQLAGETPPAAPVLIPSPGISIRESSGGSRQWPDDLGLALELIRREACTGRSIEQITVDLPISRRTLQRLFRDRLGITPQDEINRIRLARGRELLLASDFPVARIAELVGFSESAAFSKFFRQHTGQSPREYRNHRDGQPPL